MAEPGDSELYPPASNQSQAFHGEAQRPPEERNRTGTFWGRLAEKFRNQKQPPSAEKIQPEKVQAEPQGLNEPTDETAGSVAKEPQRSSKQALVFYKDDLSLKQALEIGSETEKLWLEVEERFRRQHPLTIAEIQEMSRQIISSDGFKELLAITQDSPSFSAQAIDWYFKTFKDYFQKIGINHPYMDDDTRRLALFWFSRKPIKMESGAQTFYDLCAPIYEAMHRSDTKNEPQWQGQEKHPPFKTRKILGLEIPVIEFTNEQESNCAFINPEAKVEANDALQRKAFAVEVADHATGVETGKSKKIIYLTGDGPAQTARLIIDNLEAKGDKDTVVIIREYNAGQIRNGIAASDEKYLSRIVWTQGSAGDKWNEVLDNASKAAPHLNLQDRRKVVAAGSTYVIGAFFKEGTLVEEAANSMWEALDSGGAYFGLDFYDPAKKEFDPGGSFMKEDCSPFEKAIRKTYIRFYNELIRDSINSCYGLWGHTLDNVRRTINVLEQKQAVVERKWQQTVFSYLPLPSPFSTRDKKSFVPFPGYVGLSWKAVKK